MHPDYVDASFKNDIMIHHLKKASTNQYIQLQQFPIEASGLPLTVVGFGSTDASRAQIPDQLQEVELNFVDRDTCNGVYGMVTRDMMCAAKPGADSCLGDSGGPLFIKGSSVDEDRLVGLVSWGRGCAQPGFPGVYTNVPFFYDWIVETVCSRWPEDSPEYMGCFTEAPTESPSTSPPTESAEPTSSADLVTEPAGVIELVSMSPPDGTLGHCQGNCEGDDSCTDGLVCYERILTSLSLGVPGCVDSPDVDTTDVNVCVNMTLVSESITEDNDTGNDWWSETFGDSP